MAPGCKRTRCEVEKEKHFEERDGLTRAGQIRHSLDTKKASGENQTKSRPDSTANMAPEGPQKRNCEDTATVRRRDQTE